MPKVLLFPLLILAALGVAWAGLAMRPRAFPLPVAHAGEAERFPIPRGLPAPVERFYRAAFGETLPLVKTAVFTGTGRIRPFGLWMPIRFVFVHEAGVAYRHYIEVTFFGLPLMKVDEGIVDGASFMEGAVGTIHDEPNTNQGATLALWAEALWFPSIWLSDPRVRWEPVDESSALLRVPYGDATETFVVRFDPRSGLVSTMEAMRYREPGADKPKILWITRDEPVSPARGGAALATGSATWLDQGRPWAYFDIERSAFNAELGDYLRKRGY